MSKQTQHAGKKINAVMDGALLRTAIAYILKGGLRFPGGHVPPSQHYVPEDFSGVGLSTSDDPAVDDYILAKLAELNIRNVRIDFSYDDENGPVGRLLTKLLNSELKLKVLVHLVQPFEEAFLMKEPAQQEIWRAFVSMVCERYGQAVDAIEVCSTINRRRWAGYDTEGFFNAWNIAHEEIKSRNITLAGPSVSDFEPMYTSSLLSRMTREQTLPDIYTNNLFSERVVEPERFDHRILGFKAATKLKVNLVKKARILRKIADDFNVPSVISPAAFWTLPRIERLLVDSEAKQADYLARYLVLLAASGALDKAFWGPLLCWREGLIDDGSGQYPPLERITHYKSVIGARQDFRERQSFTAMKHFNEMIPGSLYLGQRYTTNGLEVHAFKSDTQLIYVAWTRNGEAVRLRDLFHKADLQAAQLCLSGSHQQQNEIPHFICETPLYLTWPADSEVALKSPKRIDFEPYYAQRVNGKVYPYEQDGWRGLVVAEDALHAEQLFDILHPDSLPQAKQETTLRKARNLIWSLPDINGQAIVAKKPIRVAIQKRLLDRYKPSKARRSWNAAIQLGRRGVATASPVAFFEKVDDNSMMENIFICEKVEHDFSARELLTAFAAGEQEFNGITAIKAYEQLADFIRNIHNHGVYFRDLAGGNILIRKEGGEKLSFTLIDINRARFYNQSTPLNERLADLTRICNKLHWPGRELLVEHYLQGMLKRKHFTFRYRLPFYVYDFKVNFKRRYGRKAITRLLRQRSGKNN